MSKIIYSGGGRNITPFQTKLCEIDSDNSKLYIRGFDIKELIENQTDFLDVVFLLLRGRLPEKDESIEYTKIIDDAVNDNFIENLNFILNELDKISESASIYAQLGYCLDVLNKDYHKPKNSSDQEKEKAILTTLARMQVIIGALYRKLEGIKPFAEMSDKTLRFSSRLLKMICPDKIHFNIEILFNIYAILHAENGLSASASTARIVATTDHYNSIKFNINDTIIAALRALKGPKHGGAAELIQDYLKKLEENFRIPARDIQTTLQASLPTENIPGFGHARYKKEDPRASILEDTLRLHVFNNCSKAEFAIRMEALIQKNLQSKGKNIPTNVEFYDAVLFDILGIKHALIFPLIFASFYAASWMANWKEAHQMNDPLVRFHEVKPTKQEIPKVDSFQDMILAQRNNNSLRSRY